MTYQVFTSVSDCADLWNKFLPEDHYLNAFNCNVIEESQLENVAFRYVLILNDTQEVAGIAYFQLLHFLAPHYNYPLAKNYLLRKIEGAIMKKGFYILVCGNMLHVDSPGLFYNPQLINATLVLEQLERFYKALNPQPHAVLIKDWYEPENIRWVKEFSYEPWSDDLTMKMFLPPAWKNFNDYVKNLRHHYAQRVRKARKNFFPIVRRELLLSDIRDFSIALEQLYLEVVKRQALRLIIVNSNYFVEMKKVFQNDFRVFGYFLEDELIGFSSNIISGNLWELHYIGMRYQFNKKHWLYFNMMFDAISNAIAEGKSELELGRTAREAKAVLGGIPVYFKNYVKIQGIIPRLGVKFLKQNFLDTAGKQWNEKKPFKA
ncbi:MAG: hypothetical protein ABIQ74_11960 [Chitinophagales bacterium]